jgi:hypothetical protein
MANKSKGFTSRLSKFINSQQGMQAIYRSVNNPNLAKEVINNLNEEISSLIGDNKYRQVLNRSSAVNQ